jgi:hypothetical protein
MTHLEFVVPGPPISNQSQGTALQGWRATVEAEAGNAWNGPPLAGPLKAVVINFHTGDKPSLDLDNMSKPILDVLQGLVYSDDRQIRQAELAHVKIDSPLVVAGASRVLVAALQAGNQFVYVRIEDSANPLPLPR